MVSLLLALTLASSARAATSGQDHCPWAGERAPVVSVTKHEVIVNGLLYDVKEPASRALFEQVLRTCNASAAQVPLKKWRDARSGAMAALLFSIGLCWIPLVPMLELPLALYFVIQANEHRDAFVVALATSTPPRE